MHDSDRHHRHSDDLCILTPLVWVGTSQCCTSIVRPVGELILHQPEYPLKLPLWSVVHRLYSYFACVGCRLQKWGIGTEELQDRCRLVTPLHWVVKLLYGTMVVADFKRQKFENWTDSWNHRSLKHNTLFLLTHAATPHPQLLLFYFCSLVDLSLYVQEWIVPHTWRSFC